jgi:hypothetical protein
VKIERRKRKKDIIVAIVVPVSGHKRERRGEEMKRVVRKRRNEPARGSMADAVS